MMESDLNTPNPQKEQTSQWRLYSLGEVAADKPLDSKDIEVSPVESFPLLDGEITDNAATLEVTPKGETSTASSVTATVTLKATWRSRSSSNRVTAPDVRRGEKVEIYTLADSNEFFWDLHDAGDISRRRLETVTYAYSGSPVVGSKDGPNNAGAQNDNCYVTEISTHQKKITLSTSDKNGEKCRYTIQINPGDGLLLIADDQDNGLTLDSVQGIWKIFNAEGSFIELNKRNIIISAPEDIITKAGRNRESTVEGNSTDTVIGSKSSESQSYTNTASSEMVLDSPTITENAAMINMNGNIGTSGGSHGGSGTATFAGKAIFNEDVEINGNLDVRGDIHSVNLSVDNIPW